MKETQGVSVRQTWLAPVQAVQLVVSETAAVIVWRKSTAVQDECPRSAAQRGRNVMGRRALDDLLLLCNLSILAWPAA